MPAYITPPHPHPSVNRLLRDLHHGEKLVYFDFHAYCISTTTPKVEHLSVRSLRNIFWRPLSIQILYWGASKHYFRTGHLREVGTSCIIFIKISNLMGNKALWTTYFQFDLWADKMFKVALLVISTLALAQQVNLSTWKLEISTNILIFLKGKWCWWDWWCDMPRSCGSPHQCDHCGSSRYWRQVENKMWNNHEQRRIHRSMQSCS